MTRSSVWDASEIIFTPPSPGSEHSAEFAEHNLVTRFNDYSGSFLALLDAAFVLGTRNPFTEGLFVENAEGSFEVDKSLRDAEMFMGPFMELCDDAELIGKKLQETGAQLDAHRADARAVATEEPTDAAAKIQALQYALEQEKAWNERLEEEKEELKAQLSSISANPLSQSIGVALKPKRNPRS